MPPTGMPDRSCLLLMPVATFALDPTQRSWLFPLGINQPEAFLTGNCLRPSLTRLLFAYSFNGCYALITDAVCRAGRAVHSGIGVIHEHLR